MKINKISLFTLATAFAFLFVSCNDGDCDNCGSKMHVINFEDVMLTDVSTGVNYTYTDILWGLDLATDDDGIKIYDDVVYEKNAVKIGTYYNNWAGQFDSWGGFAFSSNASTSLPEDMMDYSQQFDAYAAKASTFAIGYCAGDYGTYSDTFIEFDEEVSIISAKIVNANKLYQYVSENPKAGKKPEEGQPDTREDIWVDLLITGWKGTTKTATIEIRLAEGTDILSDWAEKSLTQLGTVDMLTFDIDSNDSDPQWGVNVPKYFCLDDLVFAIPNKSDDK